MVANLDGKVVLITGAGGNVGRAIVKEYALAGAKLVLGEHHPGKVQACIHDLGLQPDQYLEVKINVTNRNDVHRVIAEAVERFGGIDILAHTVGGYAAGTPVHETNLDVWGKMMTLNAVSVFITAGCVASHMVERGKGGKIIAILAGSALKGQKNAAAYSASKAAAQRVIESMAEELKGKNIAVNAVLPAHIDVPPNREAMPNADYSKWVKPSEIGALMVFLSSDEANSINGVSVPIFGRG